MASVVVGRRGGVVARTTTAKSILRGFLERARLYAAYAICDLEEREFARTRWAMAWDGDAPIALVLEYNGPTPQPLFVMGRDDGISAILRDLIRPYQLGFASWLPSTAIADGVYYGMRVNGQLVAAAGTHVVSPGARLAVVGNVLTHVDYRGRGFACATT